jgi:hypothetical protein
MTPAKMHCGITRAGGWRRARELVPRKKIHYLVHRWQKAVDNDTEYVEK